MTNKKPRPEKEWCQESKTLWTATLNDWEMSQDAVETLRVACRSLHRYLEADHLLDEQGLVFKTSGGQIKKNPLVEVAKNERAGFLAALRSLNLKYEDDEEKRSPGRSPGRGWGGH